MSPLGAARGKGGGQSLIQWIAGSAIACNTSVLVPKPAGVVSGHFMMLVALCSASRMFPTVDSSWQVLRGDTSDTGSDEVRCYIYTKFAGGSEPANWTFAMEDFTQLTVAIGAWSGVLPSAPVNAHTIDRSNLGGVTTEIPAVTTTRPTELVAIQCAGAFAHATALTPPASHTERIDSAASASNFFTIGMATKKANDAGVQAGGLYTHNGGSGYDSVGYHVALASV